MSDSKGRRRWLICLSSGPGPLAAQPGRPSGTAPADGKALHAALPTILMV